MASGYVNRSDEFRKLLFQQSERYNIPFNHLCARVHIDYDKFIEYANASDLNSRWIGSSISDKKLIEIGNLLGLDVRFVIVVKDEKKVAEEIAENKRILKQEYVTRKEKGATTAAK